MKIIYGITKSNFGGAQRYVFDLAKTAQKAGHEVSVMCGAHGVLVDKLNQEGIKVIEIENLKRNISPIDEFRSFHLIFRTLYAENPDIFHTNSSKMGGMGNLAGRLAGVRKIIFTAHGWAFNEPRPVWQRVIIKLLSYMTVILSHKTICVSEKSRWDIGWMPFIYSKLSVIHNGIDFFELAPKSNYDFTVGTLAELHKVKGLDVLLEAWAKFRKKHHGKLVIIGTGEERARLVEQAHTLGIKDSVDFRGYVENARKYLLNFDIFVLPSRSENLPYAVLEAGSAGLPVLATRVGGIPEIIETGVSGILVDPDDAEALASALVLLYENEPLRVRLGKNLEEVIHSKFSHEKMLRDTLSLYE